MDQPLAHLIEALQLVQGRNGNGERDHTLDADGAQCVAVEESLVAVQNVDSVLISAAHNVEIILRGLAFAEGARSRSHLVSFPRSPRDRAGGSIS